MSVLFLSLIDGWNGSGVHGLRSFGEGGAKAAVFRTTAEGGREWTATMTTTPTSAKLSGV